MIEFPPACYGGAGAAVWGLLEALGAGAAAAPAAAPHARPLHSLLLDGPPDSGKSFVLRRLADAGGRAPGVLAFCTSPPELAGMAPGDLPHALHRVFAALEAHLAGGDTSSGDAAAAAGAGGSGSGGGGGGAVARDPDGSVRITLPLPHPATALARAKAGVARRGGRGTPGSAPRKGAGRAQRRRYARLQEDGEGDSGSGGEGPGGDDDDGGRGGSGEDGSGSTASDGSAGRHRAGRSPPGGPGDDEEGASEPPPGSPAPSPPGASAAGPAEPPP